MKPIKAIDAAFLQLETDDTPMHVGALFVLEPRTAAQRRTFFRRFKRDVGHCLGSSEIFTRRVAALPLQAVNPMWVTAGDVDLDYHVRRVVLPEPGTQHQLEECVADLHTPRMDASRPLWELHVIDGLQDGRLALYVKTHHAGLDGASAQVFLMSFVDAGKPAKAGARRSLPPPPPGEVVTPRDILKAAARHQVTQLAQLPALVTRFGGSAAGSLRKARDAVASLATAGPPTPRTPLNVAISGARSFASIECDLAAVKAIAKMHGATVNDVVLAACSGALRRWLVLHDALPDAPLRTAVPVSTREAGDTAQSIQVTFMSVNLHTDVENAHRRLKAIHASALEAKETAAKLKAMMPEDLPSLGLPWLLGGLARLMQRPGLIDRLPLPTNIIISNVAGPPVPLFVAGARAMTYSPVSIPYHGCALNVTVYSYDGKLFFGLTGARSALPDLRDLGDGVRTEIDILSRPPRKSRPRKRR
jgi:diacylglycerol O-acyltransferase / wax synthase